MALTNNRSNYADRTGSRKKNQYDLNAYYQNQQPEEGYIYNNPANVARLNQMRQNRSYPNGNSYYSVAMPKYQTYTPTQFSGYQTYTDNPYGGYKDFTYDPFEYEKFSYNYQDDPLYQMTAEQYTRRGQQAMDDTLSQLSARTGGIANSYSQSAAQNSYNGYMAELAAKIPELQQIARQMYDTDRNVAYNQYQDERDIAYNNYNRAYQEDYNNWQNANAINQANVDLANNYAYANWQAQEAARQAGVELANQMAMQKWAYDQDAANNNVSARNSANDYQSRLKQMAADYEAQIKSLQDAANNPTRAQQRDSDLNYVENTLIDAMVNRVDQRDIDAMLEEFYRDPDINFTYSDAQALKNKYKTKKISDLERYVRTRNTAK